MWHALSQRDKAVEKFDVQLGVVAFLKRAGEIARDSDLGKELILMVPYTPFGEAVYTTAFGVTTEGLGDHGLTRVAGAESGVGCTYAGTMGNIHVYSWQFPDVAVLCSRALLVSARLARVHHLDTIVDFQLCDFGDPTKSTVRIWVAADFEWEDRLVIEFHLSNSAEDPHGDRNDADPSSEEGSGSTPVFE